MKNKPNSQTKFTGKKGKTEYILKGVNILNEKPKYAKGAITQKAKKNK